MGREINKKKVHQFFIFNKMDNKSVCKMCGVKLAGFHSTNLKRHLTSKHGEIFKDCDSEEVTETQVVKKRKISFETSEGTLISSLVKIVTAEGKPFMFLDSEGFKEIFDPIYNVLGMNGITSRNIMSFVSVKEQAIKDGIRDLVKGKLLSLKIDVATRMETAVLCVNLQMIHTNINKMEIVVKTLGMIQLTHAHTGVYIKEKILEILYEYGINLNQIISVASDNGRNMVKAVEILNDETEKSLFEDDTGEDNLVGNLDDLDLANIHLERCAAHTLQLCTAERD
ncbi:uncharacterized protein LOC123257573 [Drosophila ananassae]|uniref:uncharacterized protein LOC123257573 n=1 Tax=Drosophila ananassae TaxID=7217 RepID=UPI001CFF7ABD|nr:uncharacterized protein LOC123257573 [Drosophila ananassae]